MSKQRLLQGNWSRTWVFLGPQPPSIFPQRWIYSKLPSWLEGERRGWRTSEARPNSTFTEVRSSYTMSQPTAPIRSCPALPPSVCGLGHMGNGVDGVDNMAAHVCTGAAAALPSRDSFSVRRCFCLHAGVCPQIRSPFNPTPESICQLAACCHRVHVGGRSLWTGGHTGSEVVRGRRRPRAAAKCYVHYLLIQKSLSLTESLSSNKAT